VTGNAAARPVGSWPVPLIAATNETVRRASRAAAASRSFHTTRPAQGRADGQSRNDRKPPTGALTDPRLASVATPALRRRIRLQHVELEVPNLIVHPTRRYAPPGPRAFVMEGCTGWRYVAEEMRAAGVQPHLAEPADTSCLRGPKRRAKTDKADARLLRELLATGRVPECYIPPSQVLERLEPGRSPRKRARRRRCRRLW
jgi:hypothetical protein